jgi:tetratricopeptide (TPR) repeat protein
METLDLKILVAEGQAAYQKKDYLTAARLYKAAAESYAVIGDETRSAEMANNCSVAYLNGGDAALALQAARDTERVFEKAGDFRQQAIAIGNQAVALEKLKRWEEAMQAYQRSAELLKTAGDQELRSYVMQAISMLQLRQRHYLEAYATLRAGYMDIERPNLKQQLLKSLIQIPYRLIR